MGGGGQNAPDGLAQYSVTLLYGRQVSWSILSDTYTAWKLGGVKCPLFKLSVSTVEFSNNGDAVVFSKKKL